MKYPALALMVLAGCDPQTLSCPTPDTCGAPVAIVEPQTPPVAVPAPAPPDLSAYPWIKTVRTEPMQWSLACDMPAEMAATAREVVGWWTDLFVQGIFDDESPCDTFADSRSPGLQIAFRPDTTGAGGWGGFDASTGHGFAFIAKGHYSPIILGIVLMHEVGHALGLDHVDEPGCLMYRGAARDYGSGLCQIEQMGLAAAYPTGWPKTPHQSN